MCDSRWHPLANCRCETGDMFAWENVWTWSQHRYKLRMGLGPWDALGVGCLIGHRLSFAKQFAFLHRSSMLLEIR